MSDAVGMGRSVGAHLELTVETPSALAWIVAVADRGQAEERLAVDADGMELEAREIAGPHGTRLHLVHAEAGRVTLDYTATLVGRADPAAIAEIDLLTYLRPSRYCESDELTPTARAEFGSLEGVAALDAVSSWVGSRLSYVPGSSLPTDGAVRTLLARRGVCRDYAHLVIALLRALDIPARLASVYAPGLDPMDFHAVAEAYVDGAWQVVDATTLAPRSTLVRIATGRDAADTAFLSSSGGMLTLDGIEVWAVADTLPNDDVRELVELR